MKKLMLCLGLVLAMALGGCSNITDLLNNTTTLSGRELYERLDSLASSPDSKLELSGTFSFVGYLADEAEVLTVEDEECMYQTAYIYRNENNPIYLDVSALKEGEHLPAGSIATITAQRDGWVYGTVDNKQVEYLNLKVTKMEAFTPSEAEPSTENKLSLRKGSTTGNIVFVGAHRSQTSFDDVIVIYFNFTNNGEDSNTRFNNVDDLIALTDVYIGDTLATKINMIHDPKEVDGGALDYSDMQAYTPAGKTQLYYMMVKDIPDAGDAPLYVDVTNDHFEWTNSIGMPIAANLAELQE